MGYLTGPLALILWGCFALAPRLRGCLGRFARSLRHVGTPGRSCYGRGHLPVRAQTVGMSQARRWFGVPGSSA
eukprot:9467896-Pyramimonas_sp.AAC.1